MNDIIKRIDSAQHIVVITHVNPDADSLGSASAMYTYLLQLHKKVSFFCVTKEINKKLAFIPWFEKIRNSFPSSADFAIAFNCATDSRAGITIGCDFINIDSMNTTEVVYAFFKQQKVSINKKMATALYAGLLDNSDGFTSQNVDAHFFSLIQELIAYGADYKKCNQFIRNYRSLASLRLEGIMLNNFELYCNAQVGLFLVRPDDMKKSGAITHDCAYALKKILSLPSVKVAVLIKEKEDLSIEGSLLCTQDFDALVVVSNYAGCTHKSGTRFEMNNTYTLESVSKEILKLIKKEL
ncbi:phosphoesterase [Sulfurimonas sp. SAG-AH-194-I05]|nr:DHH family phosphoesterase [Sulfurimonas sp. SAG-AH-194-I05]MDF1874560.1 phosphoesterase [Sulfurimonas sp. SAG-AH-194-I05]